MTIPSYRISQNCTSEEFLALDLRNFPHNDWHKAVDVFKNRFESRFFSPLQALRGTSIQSESNDSRPEIINGFIVLGCAFILVETLGGFIRGAKDHIGKSGELFVAGLEGLEIENESEETSSASNDQKKQLYSFGRCALLHTAGTEKIRVSTTGPTIRQNNGNGFDVNRDAFLDWVKGRFDAYASDLMNEGSNELRKKFKKKMGFIARN